jgi:hypothetical protein
MLAALRPTVTDMTVKPSVFYGTVQLVETKERAVDVAGRRSVMVPAYLTTEILPRSMVMATAATKMSPKMIC